MVAGALARSDLVITSDPDDIQNIARALGGSITGSERMCWDGLLARSCCVAVHGVRWTVAVRERHTMASYRVV